MSEFYYFFNVRDETADNTNWLSASVIAKDYKDATAKTKAALWGDKTKLILKAMDEVDDRLEKEAPNE